MDIDFDADVHVLYIQCIYLGDEDVHLGDEHVYLGDEDVLFLLFKQPPHVDVDVDVDIHLGDEDEHLGDEDVGDEDVCTVRTF